MTVTSTKMPATDHDYDRIVGAIYQAAVGAAPWKRPFDALALALDAWNVHLMGVDTNTGAMLFSHEGGDPPAEGTLEYIRTWHRVDPRAALVIQGPAGIWTHDHEHYDEAFVAEDPFYRDFLIPYGMRYISGIRFEPRAGVTCIFSASRGIGKAPFDEAERALLARVGEHVEAALKLQSATAAAMRGMLAGVQVLERIRYPLFLIDADRNVLYANAAAKALGDRGGIDAGARLRMHDLQRDTRLTWLIKSLELDGLQAAQPPSVRPDAGNTRPLMVLSDRRGNRLALHLTRLDSQTSMGAFGGQALALVSVFDLDERHRLDPFVIQTVFGLTPAESRVAAAVATGERPAIIAERTGVSINTVRAQIRQVFQKMGIASQVELSSILASNPVYWGGISG